MNLFAPVSVLSLALDPVLTQSDRRLDDDPLFQSVSADLSRRFQRTPIDGRPSRSSCSCWRSRMWMAGVVPNPGDSLLLRPTVATSRSRCAPG